VKGIETVALDDDNERCLLDFMSRDRVSHFYAIYDLRHLKKNTLTWIALLDDEVVGYLLEYDKRILYMRGGKDCAVPLLKNSGLTEALLNIETHQLSLVETLFEPVEPADKMTEGQITTFVTMKATRQSFRPIVQHRVLELKKESAPKLADLLGINPEQALGFFRGLAFGLFKGWKLVSYAASPEILDDLAIIREVFTAPKERNRGYSHSVCSVLVRKLLDEGKDVILYVSKDNPAPIEVYREIGFKKTGHLFLGFAARRRH
jgi:GNAT superfamily N-acetyltransferase